ncbi:MAG: DJ-1/PfpI family protein [Sneathiella sp.]
MTLQHTLNGKKIAILVANGFEESHMTGLHKPLVETGADVKIVSPEKGVVNSWHDKSWGHFFPANAHLPTSMSHHFDGVIIPGGIRHITRLSSNPQTARFLRGFMEDNKPIALFDDAVLVLAECGLIEGRKVVSSEEAKVKLDEKEAEHQEGDLFVDDMLVTANNAIEPLVMKFVENVQNYVPEAWEAA